MNLTRLLALPLALFGAVTLSAASNNPSPKIDVNIVGEVYAPGYAAPTPTAPAYYVLHNAGYFEKGDPVGGETTPPASEITQALARYLPTANFLPASAAHAPSLLLVVHWGSLREDTTEIIPPYEIPKSLRARIRLVATPDIARRIERELTDRIYRQALRNNIAWPRMLSNQEQDTLDIARDNHYFVVVTAFDYAAATRKEVVPVWRLKLSTDDRRKSLADALPALIRHGRTYFGQVTAEPIFEKLPLRPEGEVKLGDLQILGEATVAPAPELAPEVLDVLKQSESSELSGAKAKPAEAPKPAVPTALQQRLDSYRAKKLALQNELQARLAGSAPGADTTRAVDAFNRENATRIAELDREHEAIRGELAQLAKANPTDGAGKSLQALADEFATANY